MNKIHLLLTIIVFTFFISNASEYRDKIPYVKVGEGYDSNKNVSVRQDVPSGTLFIWENNQWKKLTTISEVEDSRIITSSRRLDPHKPTYIISHGWRDDRMGKTIEIAKALNKREPNAIILGVDWSSTSWTDTEGLLALNANLPAAFIPWVASGIIDQLCKLYNQPKDKLVIDNLHLIGHSHGAHLLGMVAHKLKFKPKRFTALDASTQLSHIITLSQSDAELIKLLNISTFWPGPAYHIHKIIDDYLNSNHFDEDGNILGHGWSRDDAEFVEYYKSSIMASTNIFKGHNNFILIRGDNEFEFNKTVDGEQQGQDHGYSIDWYAETISKSPTENHLGFNMEKDFMEKNWTGNFNYDQYHGVINGASNKIENFDIKFATLSDGVTPKYPNKWKYTNPWYTDQNVEGLFNDKTFRDAFATTIEYEPTGLKHISAKGYLECNISESLEATVNNNADNFSIPQDIRNQIVDKKDKTYRDKFTNNILFIGKKGSKYSINNQDNGSSIVIFDRPVQFLTSSKVKINPGQSNKKIQFDFIIPQYFWKLLGGTKDDKFIECEVFLLSGDGGDNTLSNGQILSTSIWPGELYPYNNVYSTTIKLKNPKEDEEDNEKPNPDGKIGTFIPKLLQYKLSRFSLELDYSCKENLTAQNHYKANSNYGFGLKFGYTKYFPSAIASKLGNFGLDFVGGLNYAKYDYSMVALQINSNTYEYYKGYRTRIKGVGAISFEFGPSYTYRFHKNMSVTPYVHGVASTIISHYEDDIVFRENGHVDPDGENYCGLGIGFGVNIGMRLSLAKHFGLSFGWKFINCNNASICCQFFDEAYDYYTNHTKSNFSISIKSLNVGVIFSF